MGGTDCQHGGGADIPSVVELPEVVRAELLTENIVLEFEVTYRAPEGGPEVWGRRPGLASS